MCALFWAILALVFVCLGVVLDRIFIHFKRGEVKKPINPVPEPLPSLSPSEIELIRLYQAEWEVIITTQMHFNDLIIRFRSITLTAFVALIGAALTIEKAFSLENKDLFLILAVIAILWLTAFALDFFYYHRLLLGAVAQASKFDNGKDFKRLGFFGMTRCIREHVHPPASKILIFLYYIIPFALIAALLLWRFYTS